MLKSLRICTVALGGLACGATAADVNFDPAKLPAPAQQSIDFARDIQPILADRCLRCHGQEKPKSGFRLTTRELALKGGENGVDIRPGQSAQSPLIYYVARLVPEMEMPPEGRGDPLTPEQVSLLRAWIDQGVPWEEKAPEPAVAFSATPIVGGTAVEGRVSKFRELYWQPEGWNGGVEDFSLSQRPDPDSKITAAGHFLRDDYKLTLRAERNDLGFAQGGWSQFRKYYDDSGGYFSGFSPPIYALNRDLYVDDGRAWVEFGLTLPRWPRLVLGYEYQYRNGSEATLEWGPVSNGTETRLIYPAFENLSERVHILKFDVDYELAGFRITDNFRGEWYHWGAEHFNDSSLLAGSTDMAITRAQDRQSYFQGANTVHLEKQLTDWWFGSGGYLYANLDSSAATDVTTFNAALLDPAFNAPGWHLTRIQLERESHVFSLSSRLGPWEGFLLSVGVQNEWTRQQGLGSGGVDLAVPFDPFLLALDPELIDSSVDRSVFSQNATLQFTKIPFTTLYAETRFQQDRTGEFQEASGGFTPFLLNTDIASDQADFRVGFNTSPWRRVSLNGHYRQYEEDTDYNHLSKELLGQPYEGYPGFILSREVFTREAELKLALEPARFVKTSISYKWLTSDYHTTTESASDFFSGLAGGIATGGEVLAGTYQAHIVSLGATLTPWRRVSLTGTATYQNARTVTWANDSPSVAPYAGNVYSLASSLAYALNDRTDLSLTYAFSLADFTQENAAAGLPLGINYQQHGLQVAATRRLAKGKTLGLSYRFYHYDEPSAGGVPDFDAHAVFATLALRLP